MLIGSMEERTSVITRSDKISHFISLFLRTESPIHNGLLSTFFPFFSTTITMNTMSVNHDAQKSLFDSLYCQEVEEEEEESEITLKNENNNLENDQEILLDSLLSKERETRVNIVTETEVRKQGVEWILRVNAHHGFSALTALLGVNYFDRFFFDLLILEEKDKAWVLQLVAVASLSLAAKFEETYVPLLLDLQVGDAEYLFEAKTIQRMELLILSSLKWRMNPVTPLSFVHPIVKRLRLKSYNHWEFLTSCENLILSVISDSRLVGYLPSVLAAATVIHIINQVEPSNAIQENQDYEKHILSALKINKEEVDECCELLSDVSLEGNKNPMKLKSWEIERSSSSSGAIIGRSSSNDSWEVVLASSSSSSPQQHHPIFKKRRVEEQHMKLPSSQHS